MAHPCEGSRTNTGYVLVPVPGPQPVRDRGVETSRSHGNPSKLGGGWQTPREAAQAAILSTQPFCGLDQVALARDPGGGAFRKSCDKSRTSFLHTTAKQYSRPGSSPDLLRSAVGIPGHSPAALATASIALGGEWVRIERRLQQPCRPLCQQLQLCGSLGR